MKLDMQKFMIDNINITNWNSIAESTLFACKYLNENNIVLSESIFNYYKEHVSQGIVDKSVNGFLRDFFYKISCIYEGDQIDFKQQISTKAQDSVKISETTTKGQSLELTDEEIAKIQADLGIDGEQDEEGEMAPDLVEFLGTVDAVFNTNKDNDDE